MRRTIGAGPGLAAASYAAFMLTMIIGGLTGDRVTARLGPVALVRWGGVLLAAGLGTVLSLGQVLPPWSVLRWREWPWPTSCRSCLVLPDVFPTAPRRPALAALSTASFAGFLVGPPAIGLTADHITLRGGLGIVVGLSVLIALLAPVVKPADPAPVDPLP